LFFLVREVLKGLSAEGTFEGLVHDRGTTDPYAVDFFGVKLTHLLEDKLFIPALRVEFLLGKSQNKLEILETFSCAVLLEGLK
jgi:hypothetical protein